MADGKGEAASEQPKGEKLPPPWSVKRGTPRSLTRTLLKLREEGRYRTHKEMGRLLELDPRTLQNWESDAKESFTIEVRDLQRYQDLLGIPLGIIVVISQILADARDGNRRRLEVMARMLGALHGRIDTHEKQVDAIRDVRRGKKKKEDIPYTAWDNFLAILIMTAWGSVSYPLREAFKNPERLKAHAEKSAEKSIARKRRGGKARTSIVDKPRA